MKKSASNLDYSGTWLYNCDVLHTHGRDDACQKEAGFFYALLKIIGSVPPCGCLMAPLPMRCKTTGKAGPSFISALHINFLTMSYTENPCAIPARSFAESAEVIINNIRFHEDPEEMRKHLRAMMDAYFLYNQDHSKEYKESVYATYAVLHDALESIELINHRNLKVLKLCKFK